MFTSVPVLVAEIWAPAVIVPQVSVASSPASTMRQLLKMHNDSYGPTLSMKSDIDGIGFIDIVPPPVFRQY